MRHVPHETLREDGAVPHFFTLFNSVPSPSASAFSVYAYASRDGSNFLSFYGIVDTYVTMPSDEGGQKTLIGLVLDMTLLMGRMVK